MKENGKKNSRTRTQFVPCALTRYSPNSFFSPVAGLRVKQTPVALRSLRFPVLVLSFPPVF